MKVKNRELRRAGFTLVELLLVITILGILGTVVVMNFGDVGGDARKETTRQSILAIDQAVVLYNTKVGKMPKDLSDLTKGINDDDQGLLKAKDVNDAWGNAFEYKVDGKKYTIRSAGPDGQMNTEDDITN